MRQWKMEQWSGDKIKGPQGYAQESRQTRRHMAMGNGQGKWEKSMEK